MKLAKASTEEVDALINLMRVLSSCEDDGFPCTPDDYIQFKSQSDLLAEDWEILD